MLNQPSEKKSSICLATQTDESGGSAGAGRKDDTGRGSATRQAGAAGDGAVIDGVGYDGDGGLHGGGGVRGAVLVIVASVAIITVASVASVATIVATIVAIVTIAAVTTIAGSGLSLVGNGRGLSGQVVATIGAHGHINGGGGRGDGLLRDGNGDSFLGSVVAALIVGARCGLARVGNSDSTGGGGGGSRGGGGLATVCSVVTAALGPGDGHGLCGLDGGNDGGCDHSPFRADSRQGLGGDNLLN